MKEHKLPPNSSSSYNLFTTSISNRSTSNNDNNQAILLDILSIDKHSRLTLTKPTKHSLSLNSKNKIIFNQDKGNNNRDKQKLVKIYHLFKKDKELKAGAKKEEEEQGEERYDNFILIKCNYGSYNDGKNNIDSYIESENNKDNTNNSIYISEDIQEEKFVNEEDKGEENNKYQYRYSVEKEKNHYQTPIILIDNEPDLLLTFDYILKSEGYKNVELFSDSKSLLKHLLNFRDLTYYKLVITDIRMPHINGIQLYQILKILNPDIKIMFITSLDIQEITTICTEVKSKDIIKKPVDGKHFIQVVNDKVKSLIGIAAVTTTTIVAVTFLIFSFSLST